MRARDFIRGRRTPATAIDHDQVEVSAHGFNVIICRSAGADDAVVIFIDGPDGDSDLMPDGAPRCRILLNDEPIYAPVDYEYTEDGT